MGPRTGLGCATRQLVAQVPLESPSLPFPRCSQITVTILGTTGARRKLLESVNVQTQISIDSGETPQEQQQALTAVTTVTTQMNSVGDDSRSAARPECCPA